MYPNYQALPPLCGPGALSTDYGSQGPSLGALSSMIMSLLGQQGGGQQCYGGGAHGGYGGYGGGAQASAGVSSYLGSSGGYGSYGAGPTWMPSPISNPMNGFNSYSPIFGGAALGYDSRQSVFQPCQGNVRGYGSYAQSYGGGAQSYGGGQGGYSSSYLPGYPSSGFCPPQVNYGGGQAMGGQQCGYGNFPPYKITITIEPNPRAQQPHCPPPVPNCPPPPPPVVNCPPPPPPVVTCPPPPPYCPPPPVVDCPPPAPPPPPPAPVPVAEVPRVEQPAGDPRIPVTYPAIGEGGGPGSWGPLSEAVKNRLVGGDDARKAQIHYGGQSPDTLDPNRTERMAVWHTLQADPRLRYDCDSHNFFLTSQTGQTTNVSSLDSQSVQAMNGGGASLSTFDQIRTATAAGVAQMGGASLFIPNPTSGVGEGPGVGFPQTVTTSAMFPNSQRLFG